MCEQARCHDEVAYHQLLIAAAVYIVLHIEVVFPINCFPWRGVLMMDNTLLIKKHSWHGFDLAGTLPHHLWAWTTWQLLGLHFQIIAMDPGFISDYGHLKAVCSLVVVWMKSLAIAVWCSSALVAEAVEWILPQQISYKILHQNFRHSSFWNPQISF